MPTRRSTRPTARKNADAPIWASLNSWPAARKMPRMTRKMPTVDTPGRLPGQLPSPLQPFTRTTLGGSCLLMAGE
jgi:hypothetical protein